MGAILGGDVERWAALERDSAGDGEGEVSGCFEVGGVREGGDD